MQRVQAHALGAQLQPGVGAFAEELEEAGGKAGNRLHRQAVAVVAGEEVGVVIGVGGPFPGDAGVDGRCEFSVVDEQHHMGRLVHALEEAVAAVVETVEHVREVEVAVAADAVVRWCCEHRIAVFGGQDQGRPALLQAEILTAAVEDLAVAVDRHPRRLRVTVADRCYPRVVANLLLDVDEVEHGWQGAGWLRPGWVSSGCSG